jgi:single-strand DNA-binding protein
VYIEGKIKSRKYNDKDGVERTATDIVCEKVLKFDRASSDGQNGSKGVPYDEMYKDPVVDDGPKSPGLSFDEDLPF